MNEHDAHEFPPTPLGYIPGTVQANLLLLRQAARSTQGVRCEVWSDETNEVTSWEQLSQEAKTEIREAFFGGATDGAIVRAEIEIQWRIVLIN